MIKYKQVMLTISLCCCALFFTNACTPAKYQVTTPSKPLDGFNGSTVFVNETIIVKSGDTFDGSGKLYEWTGEGDCSQREGMPPMFKLSPGSSIKNLWMKNAPDGIHIKGSNIIIDNIVNVDVCEDAISISKSKHHSVGENIKIINSHFFHCQDKAIQMTRGSNILIKNNEFYNCAKAIRVKEQAHNIRFENNKVFSSKNAIKVTGGKAYIQDNYFENAKYAFWAEKNGTIIDEGGNTFRNIESKYKEIENGKIIFKSN